MYTFVMLFFVYNKELNAFASRISAKDLEKYSAAQLFERLENATDANQLHLGVQQTLVSFLCCFCVSWSLWWYNWYSNRIAAMQLVIYLRRAYID